MKTFLLFIFTALLLVIVLVLALISIIIQIPRHLSLKPLKLNQYLYSVICGLDSFGGSVWYGKRGIYFYISSIAYYDAIYCKKNIWLMKFIDHIFFFEKYHCRKSFLSEANRLCLVPDLDEKGNFKKWDREYQEIKKRKKRQ